MDFFSIFLAVDVLKKTPLPVKKKEGCDLSARSPFCYLA
jgi:hypothetical protein